MIEVRSDTVTRTTREMRRAIAGAGIRDDVSHDDPTIPAPEEWTTAKAIAAHQVRRTKQTLLVKSASGHSVVIGPRGWSRGVTTGARSIAGSRAGL